MTNHPRLHRRKGSRQYYFRAKVPADLIEHYGQREVKFSLKTDSFKEAIQKVRIESLNFDLEMSRVRREMEARGDQPLTAMDIQRIAALHFHKLLSEDDDARALGGGNGGSGLNTDPRIEQVKVGLTIGDVEGLEIIEEAANGYLAAEKLTTPKDSDAYKRLCYELAKVTVKAVEAIDARDSGKVIDTPPPLPIQANTPPQSPVVQAQGDSVPPQGIPLSELFEIWVRERNPAQRTASDFHRHVSYFIELHGDLSVTAITRDHVRQFKDALLSCPKGQGKETRGLSFRQLLKYGETHPDAPKVSARTINDKALAALRTVLSYANRNGYRDGNPASDIRVETSKVKQEKYHPFTVEDLTAIFRSPIYTTGERPTKGGGEAAKWLPLLALFTGARREELGQLHVSDIKSENDIPFIDMTREAEDKQFKTESSKRRIPLHSELVKLGFLDYVEERRAAGDTHLFPGLKVSSGGKRTAVWGNWWGPYMRQHSGIDDPRKVFHSFRHTVKDAFREAEVEATLRDQLMGHAGRTEGDKYGSGYSLKALAKGMEKLRYPGLDLSHIKPK